MPTQGTWEEQGSAYRGAVTPREQPWPGAVPEAHGSVPHGGTAQAEGGSWGQSSLGLEFRAGVHIFPKAKTPGVAPRLTLSDDPPAGLRLPVRRGEVGAAPLARCAETRPLRCIHIRAVGSEGTRTHSLQAPPGDKQGCFALFSKAPSPDERLGKH